MAAPLSSTSPPALSLILNPKSTHFLPSHTLFSKPFPSTHSSRIHSYHLSPLKAQTTKSWRLSANLGHYLLSEASPVEKTSQEIVAADDGGSTVISALFFIAFIGLSILTVGVIYIAVTDFLQKREREKFEKEEAAKKKKKGGKKGKVRARASAGPRGFGQKVEDDDDDDVDETD